MTIQDTLPKLARFDTPTICNAIELFAVRDRAGGYMNQQIRAAFPELSPMIGFAATACFRSANQPTGEDTYASLEQQIESFTQLPGPAVVVFQDLDDPPVGATFGEIMCSAYKAFGSVGLITSGGGRDLLQVHAMNYPVFTGSTICSHGWCHLLHAGKPVRVGGLVVKQGELLHGDANGVTSIPLDIACEVADVAEELVTAEAIVLDYVNSAGPKTAAGLAKARQEMSAMLKQISARVARK
jgi:regulator of RNase E activity RraA